MKTICSALSALSILSFALAGAPAHALWHWRESDLWDGGFVPEGDWAKGWWAVQEPDILYSGNYVLAGTSLL